MTLATEIDITDFLSDDDASPYEFSASAAELGQCAGKITWRNSMDRAQDNALLTTQDQIDALKAYVKGFGAWDDTEIEGWSDQECNALFIQLISGDLRESGLADSDPDEFDWTEYEARASEGQISGNIFRADDGRVYYSLSS